MKVMKRNTIWFLVLVLVVLAGGLAAEKYFSGGGSGSTENLPAGYKIYSGDFFSLRYPEILSAKTSGGQLELTHSIPYEHKDPCDMKGDSPVLKNLTDFSAAFSIEPKNLQDTVVSDNDFMSQFFKDGKLQESEGYIDKVSYGSLTGYKITNQVEGCGQYLYYFPVESGETLRVQRRLVGEFSPIVGDHEKYLALPNVIKPEQAEAIFSEIIQSFLPK